MWCRWSLHLKCAGCGTELPSEALYCFHCNAPQRNVSNATANKPSFLFKASRHIRKKIDAIGGEYKQVTTLFADLADSTRLLSELGPEAGDKLLQSVCNVISAEMARYDGYVSQIHGDAILTLFGVPNSLEDHAIRACYAALRLQESFKRHAATVFKSHGVRLSLRVGLASGTIVMIPFDQGEHQDYRVTGESIHLAQRMEALATPGAICVAAPTFKLAEGYVLACSLGSIPIKGFAEPIEVFELTGATQVRSRLHASAMRGLSPFMGRQSEMAELQKALERTRAGHGQIVSMIGEAGVGKSRLYWEFLQSQQVQGCLSIGGASLSYGRATAYYPVIDLFKGYFQIEARDDHQKIRERVTGKLLSLDRVLEVALPALLSLLDVDPHDAHWESLDSLHKRQNMLDSIKRVLIRESQKQPLILIFEDLHWIDAETQSLLDGLVESIATSRVLLLVNYRTDNYKHNWSHKSYYRQNHVKPLQLESAYDMLASLLGKDVSLDEIKRQLIARTEGNPFFIEESIRMLVETGALVGARSCFRAGNHPIGFHIPASVKNILHARMDRLASEDKRILQAASIIGKDVQLSILEAIADAPPEDLHSSLERLMAGEFLFELRLFPETEYTFTHALTREVARQSMLRERRMQLHARTAQALLDLSADRIDEFVPSIAQHAWKGELWPVALDYLERAGMKSYTLYANVDAAKHFDRALKVLPHLPDDQSKIAKTVDIGFALRNALLPLGKIRRIQEALQELQPALSALNDRARDAKYAAFQNNHFFLAGDQPQAIVFGMKGLSFAREAGHRSLETELLYRVAQSHYAMGQYKEALALLDKSLDISSHLPHERFTDVTVVPSVVNRMWIVATQTEIGNFACGVDLAKQAITIAERAQHPLSEVMGWWSLGNLLLRKGEIDGATGALERGKSLCDHWNFHVWRPRLASTLGIAYARAGRAVEGIALIEAALKSAIDMSMVVDIPKLTVRYGQALLIAGHVQDALTHGARAAELATAYKAKGDEAWARFLVGRAYCALPTPQFADAASELKVALELANALGARPLAAHCSQALGSALLAQSNNEAAQPYSDAATSEYAALNMTPLPPHPVRQQPVQGSPKINGT